MSKKRRFVLVGIAAAVFVTVYSAGAASKLDVEEAQDLKGVFLEQTKDIDALGIFLNNFRIAAAMFIPGFGVMVGLISAYSTGVVFSALAETTPQIADLSPLLILATPFGIMELTSYGIA
ncbi:MAG: stage II sporulation protein M, partial [Nitrososphaerales archaeon]